MPVQISINNSLDETFHFVGWKPCPCSVTDTGGPARTIILRNKTGGSGGQVIFLSQLNGPASDTLELNLPAGSTVSFFIAAKMNPVTKKAFASSHQKDCVIEVTDKPSGNVLVTGALMVRMRKNANELKVPERDRLLSALLLLNTPNPILPRGKYVDFQMMHDEDAMFEIHFRSTFLPWHRAMILDLERRLQEIDAAITMPYWQFDDPSPNVFNADFLGIPDSNGLLNFSSTNPLINWSLKFGQIGSSMRVRRRTIADGTPWNPATSGARLVQNKESEAIDPGIDRYTELFSAMEGDPHGNAHVSFDGHISEITLAPADPLFFFLHTNVDRLWAKWQWRKNFRYDKTDPKSYDRIGSGPANIGQRPGGLGDFTNDSLWPWNEESKGSNPASPRPPSAPGGTFPGSQLTVAPGIKPTNGAMLDYQGQLNGAADLMFAYDDVPFEI